MVLSELLGLGTAFCIAFSGMIATGVSRSFGAVAFTRLRMIILFVIMIAIAAFFNLWDKIDVHTISILLVSGVIGIVIGDTALYAAYSRLGPRRTSLMFSLSAPFSVFMGIVFLGDAISKFDFIGLGLILIGIVIAVAFRDGNNLKSGWEEVQGNLMAGVGFGTLAALGQAIGTIMSKPVMEAGVHPVTATALRVGFAAALLIAMNALPVQEFKASDAYPKRYFY